MADEHRAAELRRRLQSARLYLVLDAAPERHALPQLLRAAVAGGVDIVQLREKHLPDEELTDVARTLQGLCGELGALFIVNDRPSVAGEAGADGVHVGQEDMDPAAVRELLGAEPLIGLSTHAPEEIDAVEETIVDYIGVGPVHPTPTKPGRPAVGEQLVSYAAAHASVPFFAIGGDPRRQHRGGALGGGTAGLRAAGDRGGRGSPARRERARLAARRSPGGTDGMSAAAPGGPTRRSEREQQARTALTPLDDREQPGALLAAIAVSLILAVAVIVGALRSHDLASHGGSIAGAAFLAACLVLLAGGMYRHRYWAVLGFEALLAFQIIVTSLALVIASTILAALLCVLAVGLAGLLFWKLVRVMGRIQAGGRSHPPAPG